MSPAAEPLLVRLPNAVGDVVMIEPTLRMLDAEGYEVTAIGPKYAGELLHGVPVRILKTPDSRAGFRELRELGARYALTLRSSFRSTRELRWAGVKIVGFRADWRSLLLWRSIQRPRGRHKLQEYYGLSRFALSQFRGDPDATDFDVSPPAPVVRTTPEAEAEAERRLAEAGVRDPFVFCCSTASLRHLPTFKLWPEFGRFYRTLEERGIDAVSCPGPGEEERCVASGARGKILPNVSLSTLAALLGRAAYAVSNDTGAMHIATAVGTPTLGLFGDTDPVRYKPYAEPGRHMGRLGEWPSFDEVWAEVESGIAAASASSLQSSAG